jgi:hypothetical protein
MFQVYFILGLSLKLSIFINYIIVTLINVSDVHQNKCVYIH